MTELAPVPPTGAFVSDGTRWRYEGALTLDNAAAVMAHTAALALPASGEVDFAALAHADSAVLAVILALRRRAAVEHRLVNVRNLPAALGTLAAAYGVDELVHGSV